MRNEVVIALVLGLAVADHLKPRKFDQPALAKVTGGAVYACAESFHEAVTISAGVPRYGAVDCTNGRTYDAGTKTRISADAGAIRLVLTTGASPSP